MFSRKDGVVFLCAMATLLAYILRVVLSQAIIPMAIRNGWDQKTQGHILSSFYYGYLAAQLPSGYLAQRFGAKYVLGIFLLISSILTMFMPLAASSVASLIALRVSVGFFQGACFPSIMNLLGLWVPAESRSSVVGFVWGGSYVGAALVLGTYPLLEKLLGWAAPFYIYGSMGILWFIIWLIVARNRPPVFITLDEEADDDVDVSPPNSIPWKAILSSKSVWAYVSNHFCYHWTFYYLLSYLPKYLNHVLGYNFSDAGFLAISPYLGLYAVVLIAGKSSDLATKFHVKLSNIRKANEILGFMIPAFLLVVITFVNDITTSLVLMIVTISVSGFAICGFASNPLDLSSKYSGIIVGIGNTIASIPGIASPMFTGYILDLGQCQDHFPERITCYLAWNLTFYIAASVYIAGLLLWVTFMTTEEIDFEVKSPEAQNLIQQ
jgi:sugar phosphate permease